MPALTDKRLAGRVALVVGAARGIGRAIAARFVAEGARVVVARHREAWARPTVEALGGRPSRGSSRSISPRSPTPNGDRRCMPSTRFGGLDILVQNAGIYPWTLIENIEPEEWDARPRRSICAACFLAAQAALPVMRAR